MGTVANGRVRHRVPSIRKRLVRRAAYLKTHPAFHREMESRRRWWDEQFPMFAIGMIPFLRRRRFGEHLVFSTHYFAVLLLYLGAFIPTIYFLAFWALRSMASVAPGFARPAADVLQLEMTLVILIVVPAIVYLTIATRRAYGVARGHAILTAVFLSWWQIVLIVYFYRAPLFFTTFYSLKWFS